jgi:hypothetical protein
LSPIKYCTPLPKYQFVFSWLIKIKNKKTLNFTLNINNNNSNKKIFASFNLCSKTVSLKLKTRSFSCPPLDITFHCWNVFDRLIKKWGKAYFTSHVNDNNSTLLFNKSSRLKRFLVFVAKLSNLQLKIVTLVCLLLNIVLHRQNINLFFYD